MKKDSKENLIRGLEENFDRHGSFYLLDYTKMTVAQSLQLRRLLRKNSYSLKVVKNRLALRALRKEFPHELRDYFEKPTAFAFAAEEPMKLARLLKDFSSQNKVLSIKGGLIEGRLLSPDRFEEVTKITSWEDLLGKLGSLMAYPLMQLLRTWQAPLNQLGRLLSQLKDKK